jgi:hypothetical protein
MSQIVTTEYGRLRRVRGAEHEWLLEIPNCGKWEPLSEEQMDGSLSVNHGAICSCGYHETHPYGAALVAAMQANILTRKPATEEDED